MEGFYGPPWTHPERLEMIRFCGVHGLNTWVHAPKDDPYHRARWREPYPEPALAHIAELVSECVRVGVAFTYALAPGLDVDYDDPRELEAAAAKCEQVRSAGVRAFQLLWDDVDHRHAPELSGELQAEWSNRFAAAVEQDVPLVVCPMGYAGTGDSPYRRGFGAALAPESVVYWSGPEVVSFAVAREELDAAAWRFGGHELLLWDNYPVNDFAPETVFLGPFRGRDPRLAGGRFAGIVANAMVQAVPSKLALATVAEWARDPVAYDPLEAFARALRQHGFEVRATLGDPAPGVRPPVDLAALVDVLAVGVDAATGAALLEPFV
ncbi:MAG: protein O-GlcNAcase [Gaiellaceae bacterium]